MSTSKDGVPVRYEYIDYEVDSDNLATITLNRPDTLNALSEELDQLLSGLERDMDRWAELAERA